MFLYLKNFYLKIIFQWKKIFQMLFFKKHIFENILFGIFILILANFQIYLFTKILPNLQIWFFQLFELCHYFPLIIQSEKNKLLIKLKINAFIKNVKKKLKNHNQLLFNYLVF